MVVRSMIRRTTGFRRRLAMIDHVPSSSITATVTVTSQPLNYYYCSSSKMSFPTTSMIIRIPPGRDNNNDNSSITEYGYDNLQRQRQQRFFSTNNNDGNGNGDNSGQDVKSSSSSSSSSSTSSTYTQLLTEATAKQLQGDVPSAIQLTIQALELMKDDVHVHANNVDENENEIAETILFLGKLYQLENQFENAIKLFEQARDLFDSSSSGGSSRKKRYFTSITHLAYAQKELGQYNVSERNYLYSLKGLEILGGYSDGMTNHTCYELSQLYKAQQKFQKAIDVLETMKMNLSNVFGKTDSKVLQLNSELANLLLLLEKQEQSQEKQPSSSAVIVTTTTTTNKAVPSSSSSSTSSSSLKNAIDLLEEAMDNLPPNSPEGRRIFMQIDELQEQQQQHQKEDQQHQKEEEDQQLLNNKLHPGYW